MPCRSSLLYADPGRFIVLAYYCGTLWLAFHARWICVIGCTSPQKLPPRSSWIMQIRIHPGRGHFSFNNRKLSQICFCRNLDERQARKKQLWHGRMWTWENALFFFSRSRFAVATYTRGSTRVPAVLQCGPLRLITAELCHHSFLCVQFLLSRSSWNQASRASYRPLRVSTNSGGDEAIGRNCEKMSLAHFFISAIKAHNMRAACNFMPKRLFPTIRGFNYSSQGFFSLSPFHLHAA